MTSSNLIRVTSVIETTPGVTPNSPRMRQRRLASEQFVFAPNFMASSEIRPDRMNSDPVLVGFQSGGTISYPLIYPFPDSPNSVDLRSAFMSSFTSTPTRYNDGTADSVITAVATTNTEVTHATGDAFVAGHLVRFTGFGVSGNNGVFKCTTGGTTTSRYSGSGITDEAAPPGAARMKVIGFQGASGDISATATGLASSSLDFTTLGLSVGQWIKIGGSATGDRFATAACNGTARITAIAANALTLDHRPTGWTTDAGSGKTIKVFFGDTIKNGSTIVTQTFERGMMGQTTPTYIVNTGMIVSQMSFRFTLNEPIVTNVTFMGMGGSESTSTLGASPDAPLVNKDFPELINRVHVGRLTEGGANIAAPNFITELTISLNNNTAAIECIDSMYAVGHIGHALDVTGTLNSYFGSDTLLAKFINGTVTSLAVYVRNSVSGQAVLISIPRVTFAGDGSPNATGRNVTMSLPISWMASKDETVTGAMITLDRFEYVEA